MAWAFLTAGLARRIATLHQGAVERIDELLKAEAHKDQLKWNQHKEGRVPFDNTHAASTDTLGIAIQHSLRFANHINRARKASWAMWTILREAAVLRRHSKLSTRAK